MSEENPTCKITKLVHPDTMPEDGNLQITIEYDNTGITGPTFYRTRKPGTWDFRMMTNTPSHVPGVLTGGHTYYAVPKGHLIFQVEVGYGTWEDPIRITDTRMIIILHPDYPAPDPGDTEVIVDIVTPPKIWPVTKRFWASPGTVITSAWVNDNREGEKTWGVKYNFQTSVDPTVVGISFVMNGGPTPLRGDYEIGPGETHVIEVKAKIPMGYALKWISFRVDTVYSGIIE